MAATNSLLDIRNVEVRYGQARAVNGVSMSIARGVVTAIIGPNGAGKTSSLKAICGMQAAPLPALVLRMSPRAGGSLPS
jgi:ABC-type branched-subunit amino acid transport system ATPase component